MEGKEKERRDVATANGVVTLALFVQLPLIKITLKNDIFDLLSFVF